MWFRNDSTDKKTEPWARGGTVEVDKVFIGSELDGQLEISTSEGKYKLSALETNVKGQGWMDT